MKWGSTPLLKTSPWPKANDEVERQNTFFVTRVMLPVNCIWKNSGLETSTAVPNTNRRHSEANKLHKSRPISVKFPPARALSYCLSVTAGKVSKFHCINPRNAPFYHPFSLNRFVGTCNPFVLTTEFKYRSEPGRIYTYDSPDGVV